MLYSLCREFINKQNVEHLSKSHNTFQIKAYNLI
jgi:hypothetical protein